MNFLFKCLNRVIADSNIIIDQLINQNDCHTNRWNNSFWIKRTFELKSDTHLWLMIDRIYSLFLNVCITRIRIKWIIQLKLLNDVKSDANQYETDLLNRCPRSSTIRGQKKEETNKKRDKSKRFETWVQLKSIGFNISMIKWLKH